MADMQGPSGWRVEQQAATPLPRRRSSGDYAIWVAAAAVLLGVVFLVVGIPLAAHAFDEANRHPDDPPPKSMQLALSTALFGGILVFMGTAALVALLVRWLTRR